MILALLVAGAVAWWTWGRGLDRNRLFAGAAALAGVGLLIKGELWPALALLLPGIWLVARSQAPARSSRAMDAEEARRVLGLSSGADADSIRTAHRRLVTRVHPDQGGSADLAGRVNAARDILLEELARRYPR
ncbi:J domain-containing protein [Rhizorhabdus argentea]|uniref:molecular chaperone DnaJ n=1 Tax=Rhizorhabdus argentea TaxID=1387174 RepID=UPI0030EF3570